MSILSFMFIVTVMSLCNRYYEEKKKGIFQRTLSTSISKIEYFNYSLVSWYILRFYLIRYMYCPIDF